MELIGIMKVQRFARRRPQAKTPLAVWVEVVSLAEWSSPHDVLETLGQTDFLGHGLAIFNIGGNKYRISATITYERQLVVIRYVMTHKEYDKRSRDGTL